MTREYTRELLEMVEEGMLNERTVLLACLNHMSEDDVKEMMEANDFIENDEDEEIEFGDEENGC